MNKIIIFILVLATHLTYAQKSFNYGLHTGVGTTWSHYTNLPKNLKLEEVHHINYQVGVWIKHSVFSDKINVESALIFYRRTEEQTFSHLDPLIPHDVPHNGVLLTNHYQWQTWQLRIPVLAAYSFGKISFAMGPSLHYIFAARNKYWIEVAGYESYEQYAIEQGYDISKIEPMTPPKVNYMLYGIELHAGYYIRIAERLARIEISGNRTLTRLDNSYPYTYDLDVRLIYFLKPM